MAFKHILILLFAGVLQHFFYPVKSASAAPCPPSTNPWDFCLDVCTLFSGTAPCINLPTVQGNMFNFFILAAFEVCTGVFLLGCLYLVLSGGSQTLLDKGKNIIRYSLIAYAIIGGSFIILRAMTWLLYSG